MKSHTYSFLVALALATGCHPVPEPPVAAGDAANSRTPDADEESSDGGSEKDADPHDTDEPSGSLPESCAALLEANPDAESGTHTIRAIGGEPTDVTCDMEGGWTRVALVDVNQTEFCPGEWELRNEPLGCGRGDTEDTLRAAGFPVPHEYREVRGRARGIQFRSTDSFGPSRDDNITVADGYVDGLAILRGPPEALEHVWTFASAFAEFSEMYVSLLCPCKGGAEPPAFVGDDYFCESGWEGHATDWSEGWETQDVLWDESDCTEEPRDYFEVDLGSSAVTPLRARLLLDSGPGDENLLITELELWIR